MTEKTLVDTEAAALALCVSPATIRQWSVRGKLSRHGTPKRALWDLAELLAISEQRGVSDSPDVDE
jgi:hypothetical protein